MCLHQLYLEECKGIVLANCRQPVVSQARWFSKLVLDGCLLPVVTQSAGDALEITATTSHAGIGHLIVGQGTGTVVNNSPSTVTIGPVLQNATQTLLGGGIFTSIATAPRFLDQTAIVGSAAYVSTGTTAPGDWKKTTP